MHSSNIGEKMGVQFDSTSAIYRLQESSLFCRGEILYNILIEFGFPMKLRTYSNYSGVCGFRGASACKVIFVSMLLYLCLKEHATTQLKPVVKLHIFNT
jgi:hypothetical protein